MTRYYDKLETRLPDARRSAQAAALPGFIAHARETVPHYAMLLAHLPPDAPFAALPLTRKSDLVARQQLSPPFGGMGGGAGRRVFMSPGPIFEPEGNGPDSWRCARALYATGLRKGDLLHNSFAYHFTPAGVMLEEGALAIGCRVFPAGTGNTEMQARAAAHLRPGAWTGTPDFLKAILEAGDAAGLDLTCLRRAHVSGGAFLPALRQYYAARGLTVMQSYASADCGVIAYETEAHEGLVVDEGVKLEIVRPGTGDPVPDGEVGEVVVTVFDTSAPLLRYATGDLSAVMPGRSPCGRTNTRIRGWMGRADQAAKVKGMFVRPEQIATLARAFPQAGRLRLVVAQDAGADAMTLRVEAADASLAEAMATRLHALTNLRGAVEVVPPGSLPNDGKVIDDTRPVG